MYENIKTDITINENDFKEEWLQQPRLFLYYSTKLADSKKSLSEQKEVLKLEKSQLIMDAKTGTVPIFQDKKPTESMIEAWYRTQESYKQLKKDVIQKEHEVNVLEGIVFAFHQKKTALENLVQLYKANYMPELQTEKTDEKQMKQRKRLRQNNRS